MTLVADEQDYRVGVKEVMSYYIIRAALIHREGALCRISINQEGEGVSSLCEW